VSCVTVQQVSAQGTDTGGLLVLRLGPCVVYGGPGLGRSQVRVTSVLAWLQERRLRLFDNARPDPVCLLDMPVSSFDLDLTRLPRDRSVTVTGEDGSVVLLVAQPGSCACSGSGMLRGWTPPT
jgi:hypothetical protein